MLCLDITSSEANNQNPVKVSNEFNPTIKIVRYRLWVGLKDRNINKIFTCNTEKKSMIIGGGRQL